MLILATTIMNVIMTITLWVQALDQPGLSLDSMAIITVWVALNILAAIRILGPRR